MGKVIPMYQSSFEFDEFKKFVANDPSLLSNSIAGWGVLPKYFTGPELAKTLITMDGLGHPSEITTPIGDKTIRIKIQPALITNKDGSTTPKYPGKTEDLIEEILLKFLSIRDCGVHDVEKRETWVKFSLHMIQVELSCRNKKRSLPQIREALEVMANSRYSLYDVNMPEPNDIWHGSIVSDLKSVFRKDYESSKNKLHSCRLSPLVTSAIRRQQYYQYNYDRSLRYKGQLTRFIDTRLVQRYTYASRTKTHHFMYSSIVEESGLIQGSDAAGRKAVKKALNELVTYGVLASWKDYPVTERANKIVDVKYVVQAGGIFIKEQTAANKRRSDAGRAAIAVGIPASPVKETIIAV